MQLWDAETRRVRASYPVAPDGETLVGPLSLAFDTYSQQLVCGTRDTLFVFDPAMPLAAPTTVQTGTRREGGARGLVSALAFNPDHSSMCAVGTFLGHASIFDARSWTEAWRVPSDNRAGLVQLQFSPCGRLLLAARRKSPWIECWDVRATGTKLFSACRVSADNQRIAFDIDPGNDYLVTGSQDTSFALYSMADGRLLHQEKDAHAGDRAVAAVALRPTATTANLATGSGARAPLGDDLSSSSSSSSEDTPPDHSVRLWTVTAADGAS